MSPRLAIVLAATAACAQAAEPPPAATATVDSAAVVAAARDAVTRTGAAEVAGNATEYAAQFLTSARIDYPGLPALIGRPAIEAAATAFFAERDHSVVTQTPTSTTAAEAGLAYEMGTYLSTYTTKGSPAAMTEFGRYAAAIVKDGDGQWRLSYMMAFPDSTRPAK
ncbi:MAG: hypothetical protein FJ206_10775 [Gemmatimonadetes bacterium]|nr:hypothetical protein [Gemmatimonadota bacterium]